MILLGAPMFRLFIMIITYWVPSSQNLLLLYKVITLKLLSILAYCHFMDLYFFFSKALSIFDLNLGKKMNFPMEEDFKNKIIQKSI